MHVEIILIYCVWHAVLDLKLIKVNALARVIYFKSLEEISSSPFKVVVSRCQCVKDSPRYWIGGRVIDEDL